MSFDDMAYLRGRADAMAGKARFPQSQHPDQYGAYNQGFHDWHKLQAFPDILAALEVLKTAADDFHEHGKQRHSHALYAALEIAGRAIKAAKAVQP